MADTSAIIPLSKLVDRFVFKYKLPDQDYALYFEHAADCIRELSIHAISQYRDVEIAVSSLGVISMPSDMLDFIGVALSYKGNVWYFTENQYMIIQASDSVMPTDYDTYWYSYGTTGAKNLYYFKLDWEGREIHIDGAEGENVRLQYISSGLDTAATCQVPIIVTPAVDAYLRWAQGEIDGESINEQLKRKRTYEEQFRLLKLQSLPSLKDIRDYFLGMTTQSALR